MLPLLINEPAMTNSGNEGVLFISFLFELGRDVCSLNGRFKSQKAKTHITPRLIRSCRVVHRL